MKLLVTAQSGQSGHRGKEATLSILNESCTWEKIEEDCAEFVEVCLNCMTGKTEHKIPRPLSMIVDGTRLNEVIHNDFDFLYMGTGIDGLKYVLVIRDDLSSYLCFIPTKTANSEAAANGIEM